MLLPIVSKKFTKYAIGALDTSHLTIGCKAKLISSVNGPFNTSVAEKGDIVTVINFIGSIVIIEVNGVHIACAPIDLVG